MIKSLDKLLAPYLEPNESISDVKYSRLTGEGENYGSILLKIDVVIENDTKKERNLHLVGKILPETEFFRKLFRIQETFTNEMAFYEIIIPAVLDFQKEIGFTNILNCFAKCCGARKNLLKDSVKIDDNAILLLENLIVQGFKNIDRTIGFDLQTAKLLLKDLARFHSAFIALKIKRPNVFNTKVLPYCKNFKSGTSYIPVYRTCVNAAIKNREDLQALFEKTVSWSDIERSTPREPGATVIHTDLWTNNTMQKFVGGISVENKFVDFQVFTYGSYASDVFFYIWSSVSYTVVQKHLDDLLEHYHKELIQNLKAYQCDINKFSYDEFLNELRLESQYEFSHALQFYVMLGKRKTMTPENSNEEIIKSVAEAPSEYRDKICYMIEECHKRDWLH